MTRRARPAVYLPLLLVLVACRDPSLGLTVQVPAAYRDLVDAVVVQVLQPPVGEPLQCEKLALGLVPHETVRVAKLREVVLRSAEDRPIGQVDRLIRHVFLASGLGSDGAWILGGCQELPPFEEDRAVQIDLEPVVKIAMPTQPYVAVPVGRTLPEPFPVEILDARGKPAAGVSLSWTATGAGQVQTSGQATADALGRVTVQPRLPGTPGPVAVDLRARWAEPARVPGFVQPATTDLVVSQTGMVASYEVGRLAPSGATGIAAVVVEQGQPRRRLCFGPARGAPLACPTSHDVPLPEPGNLARLPLDARDRLLVVGEKNVVAIDGDTAAAPIAHGQQGLVQLLPAGSCPQPDRALASFSNANVLLDGAGKASPLPEVRGTVVASGCVSVEGGTGVQRIFVAVPPEGGPLVHLPGEPAGSPREFPWMGQPIGIGFPSPRAGRHLVLSARPNLDQLVVARGLLHLEGPPAIRTIDYDMTPALAQQTDGGDVDGDGALDIVALLHVQARSGPPERLLWIAVDSKVGGLRVTGVLPLALYHLCAPRLWVTDINDDKIDDILLADSATCPTGPAAPVPPARVLVLTMGAAPVKDR